MTFDHNVGPVGVTYTALHVTTPNSISVSRILVPTVTKAQTHIQEFSFLKSSLFRFEDRQHCTTQRPPLCQS